MAPDALNDTDLLVVIDPDGEPCGHRPDCWHVHRNPARYERRAVTVAEARANPAWRTRCQVCLGPPKRWGGDDA